jgi:hypothetical protein
MCAITKVRIIDGPRAALIIHAITSRVCRPDEPQPRLEFQIRYKDESMNAVLGRMPAELHSLIHHQGHAQSYCIVVLYDVFNGSWWAGNYRVDTGRGALRRISGPLDFDPKELAELSA